MINVLQLLITYCSCNTHRWFWPGERSPRYIITKRGRPHFHFHRTGRPIDNRVYKPGVMDPVFSR